MFEVLVTLIATLLALVIGPTVFGYYVLDLTEVLMLDLVKFGLPILVLWKVLNWISGRLNQAHPALYWWDHAASWWVFWWTLLTVAVVAFNEWESYLTITSLGAVPRDRVVLLALLLYSAFDIAYIQERKRQHLQAYLAAQRAAVLPPPLPNPAPPPVTPPVAPPAAPPAATESHVLFVLILLLVVLGVLWFFFGSTIRSAVLEGKEDVKVDSSRICREFRTLSDRSFVVQCP